MEVFFEFYVELGGVGKIVIVEINFFDFQGVEVGDGVNDQVYSVVFCINNYEFVSFYQYMCLCWFIVY